MKYICHRDRAAQLGTSFGTLAKYLVPRTHIAGADSCCLDPSHVECAASAQCRDTAGLLGVSPGQRCPILCRGYGSSNPRTHESMIHEREQQGTGGVAQPLTGRPRPSQRPKCCGWTRSGDKSVDAGISGSAWAGKGRRREDDAQPVGMRDQQRLVWPDGRARHTARLGRFQGDVDVLRRGTSGCAVRYMLLCKTVYTVSVCIVRTVRTRSVSSLGWCQTVRSTSLAILQSWRQHLRVAAW